MRARTILMRVIGCTYAGQLTGGSIYYYQYQVQNGVQTACSSFPNYNAILAHELGHSLGLWDTYLANPGQCLGAVMSAEYVFSDECQMVQQSFQTRQTQPPPPPPPQTCNNATDGTCESPIVIALGNGDYELSSTADPVWFDLDANGVPEHVTWTARGAQVAFLALDRNGNGVIDNGSELFGNHTPRASGGVAANGFAALAEFDDNHDGVIDSADAVWDRLLLWVDWNHDGVSQPGELYRLTDFGITALEYDTRWTGRKDSAGNVLRYQSMYHRGRALRPYYDVYFVRLP